MKAKSIYSYVSRFILFLFFVLPTFVLTAGTPKSSSSTKGSSDFGKKFYLKIEASEGIPKILCDSSKRLTLLFSNAAINQYFSDKEITAFQKAFPTAKTPSLQKTYEVHANNPNIMSELPALFPKIYLYTEPISEIILLDDDDPTMSFFPENKLSPVFVPNDPYFPNQTALALMNAQAAWDISHGDMNIHIGITDEEIQPHEDVESKIDYRQYPWSGGWHGTAVAGCAAAATNNNIGIASTGFNCRLYSASTGINNILLLSQMGAKVVNASWISSCYYNSTDQVAINEIHDNGTVIVAGAGNGPNGAHCGSDGNGLAYPASYNHVISVSSVGHMFDYGTPGNPPNNWKDVHEERIGDPSSCHTHNDSVDLTAPGYNVWTTCTYSGGLYQGVWGTSFSSPEVAGVAALLFSINPCLSPDDVEYIMKSTAVNIDAIPENVPYAGLLGAGRVDAGEAANMAIGDNLTITTNITWSTPRFIHSDVIIESGGSLTIINKVKFASSARLIVSPHGKLIIDGGYLTNLTGCSNTFWPGILILGDQNQNQYPWNYPDYQGMVTMLHGAKIENALVAVSVGDPSLPSSSGGVLKIEDGTFLNNMHGIDFQPYTNHHPINGSPIPNISYVKNCSFNVNDKLFGGSFYAHVTLHQVDGIRFCNTQFENARTQLLGLVPQGFGILSFDANFLVLPICNSYIFPCPPNNLLKSKFTGLNYGIYAIKNSTTNNFVVDNTLFESNKRAIFSTAVNNVSITNSDFNIGNNTLPPIFQPVNAEGIVINTGTNYNITENTLYTPVGCTTRNVGIRIRQTGENENQVYKNDLRRLQYGIMASGSNRSSTNTGLQILCNHLENNTYAIYVNPDSSLQTFWQGIRTVQGNYSPPAQSAGNVFINNGTNQGDICNLTTNAFYYLYSPGTGNPIYVTPYPLIVKVLEPLNPCPSIINNQNQTKMTGDSLNSSDKESGYNILNPNGINSISDSYIVAYPNPASYQITFSYKLPELNNNARLIISDMYGRQIDVKEIYNSTGKITWNTSKVANGIYIYELLDEKVLYKKGKINIIH